MSTVHDCKPGGYGARHGLPRLPTAWCLLACLFGAPPVHAGPSHPSDPVQPPAQSIAPVETHVLTSHGLLTKLQAYMHQRNVQAEELSADQMVRLMVDWFRLEPMDAGFGTPSTDALVFRYGGWSEGCATAFKLSLLRRVADRNAGDGAAELLAGVTLMYEPSGQAELLPFSTATSDWKSTDAFLQAVEGSAAFRVLAGAKP
ncbi:MAG TPA: hypothetical protein VF523_01145, partial [Burkholderiales bacterium]